MGSKALLAPFTWLDSAHHHFAQTHWSIFAEAPRHAYLVKEGAALMDGSAVSGDPLELLGQLHRSRSFKDLPREIPWPGAILAVSYDFKDFLEPKSQGQQKSTHFPDIVGYFFDMWVVEDHQQGETWLLGVEHDFDGSFKKRFQDFYNRLLQAQPAAPAPYQAKPLAVKPSLSNYLQSLQTLLEGMRRGDFYQANMTRKYDMHFEGQTYDLYRSLRQKSPSPYGAYMEFGHQAIMSASPEQFIQLKERCLATYPIKGTRPRLKNLQKDQVIQQELLNSSKDLAELTMIVDLCRNDLARICEAGSVEVPNHYQLQTFSGVHHLVGHIEGQICENWTIADILKASFPGGSITGAPKIAAMKALADLEPEARGFYTGSLFLLCATGDLDSNILIRTLLCDHRRLSFQVGGGIVIDSDPLSELQETQDKAQTLFKALSLTNEDFDFCEVQSNQEK